MGQLGVPADSKTISTKQIGGPSGNKKFIETKRQTIIQRELDQEREVGMAHQLMDSEQLSAIAEAESPDISDVAGPLTSSSGESPMEVIQAAPT